MTIRSIQLAIVASVLAAGCATTGDTITDESVQEAGTSASIETAQGNGSDPNDPDEVICKKVKKVGTRFKERVCATHRDWELSEEYARDATEKIQRRPTPIEY